MLALLTLAGVATSPKNVTRFEGQNQVYGVVQPGASTSTIAFTT